LSLPPCSSTGLLIVLDIDAAGQGWYIDPPPERQDDDDLDGRMG
jgi:hypothetical protein